MVSSRSLALGALMSAGILALAASGHITHRVNASDHTSEHPLVSATANRAPEAASRPQAAARVTESAKAQIVRNLLQAPMSFEINQGQTDERVKFLSRGSGYTLFLTPSEAVLALNPANTRLAAQGRAATSGFGSNPGNPLSVGYLDRTPKSVTGIQPVPAGREDVLQMRLLGANPQPRISGVNETASKSNYFIGKDPSKWRANVSNFAKVQYAGVYPGVDLVYYGNQRQLEYDFVVAPGVDPGAIILGFSQVSGKNESLPLRIGAEGELIVHLAGGDVSFHKPVVYQSSSNGLEQTKQSIDGRYTLKADGRVGFEVGSYDRSRQLVIDPIVSFSTYLGGDNEDLATGVGIDKFDDVIIAGSTRSADFPVASPIESYHPGTCAGLPCRDVFVSKFNPTGTNLQYSTYVGGSNDDVASDLVLDKAGDIFVVGYTLSTDFPVTPHATQKTFGGGTVTGDAFAFELASKGGVAYGTYIGGSGEDQAYSVTVDYAPSATPALYVVGYTTSQNFPVTSGAYQTTCGLSRSGTCENGFATKLGPQDTSVAFSTYLGGSGGLGDAAYGVAVDSNNNIYIAGITGSPNFPTTAGAYSRRCGSDGECDDTFDGFVTEMNTEGNGLVFSTFLGGSNYDYAAGIALDSAGAIYVSGNTISTDFPITTGAAQSSFGGMSSGCVPTSGAICGDVTVTKLNAGGSTLAYSTYLGGSLDEYPGMSMSVDANGNAYVTGQTSSLNFPQVNPFQPAYGGGTSDAFLTVVNSTGTAFGASSYFGGNGQDFGYRTVLDPTGDVFVSGGTLSTNLFVTQGAFQSICGTDGTCNGGLMDAWVAKMVQSADLSISLAARPNPVTTGSDLTFQIIGRNNGPDAAQAISATDTVPAGSTFVSVATTDGSCTSPPVGGTGTVTCTANSLTNGSKITITMVVKATAASGSKIVDKPSISSTTYDPKKGNNSAAITVSVN